MGGGELISCNVNLFAAVLIIRCQWRHFDTIWDQIFSKFMYSFFIYIHLIFRLMQLKKLENGRLPVFSISQYMYNIIVIKLYSIKCLILRTFVICFNWLYQCTWILIIFSNVMIYSQWIRGFQSVIFKLDSINRLL